MMKSTYMFRDQVNTVTGWFTAWNECEQTVALYSLLRIITPTQAKFLLQVLQQSVVDCTEIQQLERQANSPAYISSLCKESKEHAVVQLLAHLPLLKPGNKEAKSEYLKIIPMILTHSIENGIHIEESRQLLSYSLIHPAINNEERSQFTSWLAPLEEQSSSANTSNLSSSYIYSQQSRLSQQTQSNGSSPDLYQFSQYSDTGSNGSSLSYNSLRQAMPGMRLNGWQQPGSRDSGIVVNGPESSNTGVHANGMVSTSNTANSNSSSSGAGDGSRNDHVALQVTTSAPLNYNNMVPQSQSGGNQPNLHRRLTRSSSVTPPMNVPTSNVSDWLNMHEDMVSRTTRSHSVNSDAHAPLSPQSSVTSSGSSSDAPHQDDHSHSHHVRNSFLEGSSGMKDVPIWLKSLRLHKYSYLFQTMTYEDMMDLTEHWLETQNVTKGARHKIVLSIAKLRERQNLLRQMEKEIMEGGNLKLALTEMKNILATPLKAYTPPQTSGEMPKEGTSPPDVNENKNGNIGSPLPSHGMEGNIPEKDVPGHFTRVMGKACTQLMVTSRPDDECFPMYLQLIERCINHEAFTQKQKKLLLSWRQQIQKIWHPPMQKYALEKQRRSWSSATSLQGGINLLARQRPLRGGQLKPIQPQWAFKRPSLTGAPIQPNMPLYRNNSLNTAFNNARPGLFEQVKQQVQRTHSAPIKSSHFGLSLGHKTVPDMNVTEPEINARLDSLCLSMTEHALGSFDNPDRGSTF